MIERPLPQRLLSYAVGFSTICFSGCAETTPQGSTAFVEPHPPCLQTDPGHKAAAGWVPDLSAGGPAQRHDASYGVETPQASFEMQIVGSPAWIDAGGYTRLSARVLISVRELPPDERGYLIVASDYFSTPLARVSFGGSSSTSCQVNLVLPIGPDPHGEQYGLTLLLIDEMTTEPQGALFVLVPHPDEVPTFSDGL